MVQRSRRQEIFEWLEKHLEFPMLCLAVLFIPLVGIPFVFDLSPTWDTAFFVGNLVIWAAFALELVLKTSLAPRRFAYLRSHWFDVVIVVLPLARPLGIARSARVLRIARAGRLASVVSRASHSVRAVLEQHGLDYILAVSLLVMLASAGAITIVERNADGNIKSFGDGLWWAATTVTTVGYGDRFPVTVEGRVIATLLGLLGISLFSLITANISAFLTRRRTANEPTLREIKERLQRLEELIERNQR